jgi:hypothetical protein
MSKQENSDESPENTITYVYIPDEQIYGTIISHGAWASLIEYYENGIGYKVEIPNDEFIVVDEIGIGYIEETEEDL